MSRNPGKSIHRPAKEPVASPVGEGPGLLLHNLSGFYSNFFDLIGIMAVLIDDHGTVRLFNRKAENLTGYLKSEVIGHEWFSLVVPEQQRSRARDEWLGGLMHVSDQMTLSMPVLARNGSLLPVCWSLSTVKDDDGKLFGLIGLGFVPGQPDAPCLQIGRQLDNYRSSVGTMTHDLLNHSQVVMGYLEIAMEHSGDNTELHCMLDRATKSIAKCGSIAVDIHKLSYSHI
jgi:PAS domain S-box-containing protein